MFASLISKRGTILDNAAVSLSDDNVWETIFGGEPTDTGEYVNGRKALEYAPVWQAVAMIAEDVSTVPTFVYKRLTNGGKERAKKHPAYRLLRRKANPLHTAQLWKQIMVAQALIYGNAYSWILRDEYANPWELLILNPDQTKLVNVQGAAHYETRISNQRKTLSTLDVFHLRGNSVDELGGLNLIEYARNSLARGIAAGKYASKFYTNNAMPAGVLTHPHRLGPEALQHLRESIESMYGGLDKAHRIAVLEEGMTWTALGADPEKSQMLATLQFSVKDVARFFKIPPHRLGDDVTTSYASVEQENLSYQQSTLTPWFVKLREEAFDKLLTEREKETESHTIEELRLAILAADAATRANFYSRGLLDGWLNRDEVREYENLNPIPDGLGQAFMAPLNMQLLGEEPDEDEPDEDEPAPDPEDEGDDEDQDSDEDQDRAAQQPGPDASAQAPAPPPIAREGDRSAASPTRNVEAAQLVVLSDAAQRASKRLAHYTQRAARDPAGFCSWLESFAQDHREVVAAMFGPAERMARALGIETPASTELAARLFGEWSRECDQVTRQATAGELADQVVELAERYTAVGASEFARRQIGWSAEQQTSLSS